MFITNLHVMNKAALLFNVELDIICSWKLLFSFITYRQLSYYTLHTVMYNVCIHNEISQKIRINFHFILVEFNEMISKQYHRYNIADTIYRPC